MPAHPRPPALWDALPLLPFQRAPLALPLLLVPVGRHQMQARKLLLVKSLPVLPLATFPKNGTV